MDNLNRDSTRKPFIIHLRVRTAPVITVEKYKIASDLYCVAQNNNNNSLDEDFHHQ